MGEDESKHRVPWIDLVRYAVAGVVTVLTIAVIAGAIILSLRPELLQLRVANGYVTVLKIKSMSQPVNVSIYLVVKAINPAGRAAIRYHNATVHFLYNKSQESEITYFDVSPGLLSVAPQIERDANLWSGNLKAPEDVPMEFAWKMFKEQEIKNATVIFKGILKTQISALNYTRGSYTKYSCFPVTIGTSPPQIGADDVPCIVG
ncbi:unnamed protein product [Urochloa decumbens]|uniref:Late embryogenesis abundant protein LEA-2 subgroup domain-containing protein n=1 Tax=Urochloa decumbens TaxID=240449 RepID=A0ABC9GXZ6_9POAL